jgi:hypothetical protein
MMFTSRDELNESWTTTADEAQAWAQLRHNLIPAMTGSPSWLAWVGFLEGKLLEYGAVDVYKNRWPFSRWETSDGPSRWSLHIDGQAMRVAFYGANSGTTGAEGLTKELILYDHDAPPESIADKIVVIPTRPHPNASDPGYGAYAVDNTFNDYEYRSSEDSYWPLYTTVDPAHSFTFDICYQLRQRLHQIAVDGQAAGLLIVYDMAFERTEGLYSFPVPDHYDCPTLTLDRVEGAIVIAAAEAGKFATLRLEAEVIPSEAYQLICYLPGKDYGTTQDEQIILVNHTDGPSITQDNGALGLLGIVKYFSHVPQAQRRRTLKIFLDCRHYMPGMEPAHTETDYFKRHPQAIEKIVGLIQIEHTGEMDHREVKGRVEAVGIPEQCYLWCRENSLLIESAIQAVKEHDWPRVQVSAPERLGMNGGYQQIWWGLGIQAMADYPYVLQPFDVPGFGLGSFLGYYWTTRSGIERWNSELHLTQVKAMTQLTGLLMYEDLDRLKPTGSGKMLAWEIEGGRSS